MLGSKAETTAGERVAGADRGPRVGVMMLDTAFPRPLGDVGNPATFSGGAIYEVVSGATPARAMRADGEDLHMVRDFVEARNRLIARGAELITTTCGFLVLHQQRLSEHCDVPLVTSSLLQLKARAAELPPGRRLAVLTVDSSRLQAVHLEAAEAPPNTVVGGVENGRELMRVLVENDPTLQLDLAAAECDVFDAGEALVSRYPDIGAVVLECANMPPYRGALARHLSLPIFDILTYIDEVWQRTTQSRQNHC